MSRRWVANASPLIALTRSGHAGLLEQLCDHLVVPVAVAGEIGRGPVGSPTRLWLEARRERLVRPDAPIPQPVLAWDLGAGEASVIAWACAHPDYEAILDDRAARACAVTLSVTVRGTLGILLLAKSSGVVTAVRPLIDAVEAAGLFVGERLRATVLGLADE